MVEMYLSWDQIITGEGLQSGGPSSSSCNMQSQSAPAYVSDESPWDNYTTSRGDVPEHGFFIGEGSWSSGPFSGGDIAGPSSNRVPVNIRPDASRCLPPIISSTDMPSSSNIPMSGGMK